MVWVKHHSLTPVNGKGDEQLVGDWITESDEMKSQIQFEHLVATN